MNDNDYSLTKEVSGETINSWSKRNYIGKELQERLVKAGALIIPNEGYGDSNDIYYFPEGTEYLVSFLQKNNKEDQYIDICIEEDNYKELAQHAGLLIIAGVIATKICAPLLVNLISEYIKKRLGSRANDTTVKTSLTVSNVNEGKSICLTYEGPASTYENIMLGAVKEILKEEGKSSPELKTINTTSDIEVNDGGKQS
jgi:hypothetical protein